MLERNGFDERLVAEIPHLRRYARALTRRSNTTEAEDLVQTCLERALAHAPRWDPNINLRARLFAIIHNLFVSAVRRPVRELNLPDAEAADRSHEIPEQHLELKALSAALDDLPVEQREAVILVALEGMSYEQVARIMEIPVGTVRSRLSRGREALRQATGRPSPAGSRGRPRKSARSAKRRRSAAAYQARTSVGGYPSAAVDRAL